MRILSTSNAQQSPREFTPQGPLAIALGNFDGVHRGHQRVLQRVLDFAQVNAPLPTAVVSFDPHPRTFFRGQPQPLLTPLREKVAQLTAIGIDQLILLPFTEQLAHLSPREFVQRILVEKLETKFVSVGEDFCFGYQRQGTVQDLQLLAQPWGITVAIAALAKNETERISSSQIRRALQNGEIEKANHLLGRPYLLQGEVVLGEQLGRKLGFPTANLALPPDKLWPCYGVYAGLVNLPGQKETIPTVINLGDRPTVNGKTATAEVHLLHWSGDLYGQCLSVALQYYLRPQEKFASLEALKTQIEADGARAESLLPRWPVSLY